jgi:hypothetical protein
MATFTTNIKNAEFFSQKKKNFPLDNQYNKWYAMYKILKIQIHFGVYYHDTSLGVSPSKAAQISNSLTRLKLKRKM